MSKWRAERIKALKRYIQADTKDLESWERDLKRYEDSVITVKAMIDSKKHDIAKTKAELAKQEEAK